MKYLLYTLSFFISNVAHSQTTFYIQVGKTIRKIENEDPKKIKVKEWQIRLYKKGQPKSGEHYWSIIHGGTTSEVITRLKISQEFELNFNSFVGKGRVQDEILTHFNFLGPIGIIELPTSKEEKSKKGIEKIIASYKKANKFYEEYKKILKLRSTIKKATDFGKKQKPSTPFDNFGKVFKEYTDNLKGALSQVYSLKKLLNTSTDLRLDKINQLVNEIDKKFATTENKQKIVLAYLTKNSNNKNTNFKKNNSDKKNEPQYYMFVTTYANIRGGKFTKRAIFFSVPISYSGNFENSKLKIKEEFLSKIERKFPGISGNISSPLYTLSSDDSDDKIDRFETVEECISKIEDLKQESIKGWGGDNSAFIIIDIE